MNWTSAVTDLLVFSHHRWDFVVKRPQHLCARFAHFRRVFYVEEPVWGMSEIPRIHLRETKDNVLIAIPHLPSHIEKTKINAVLIELVNELILEENITDYTIWYYTPLALKISRHLRPRLIVYDCMDELALFQDAPSDIMELEAELLRKSDLVTVAGKSLYESKKHSHHNIYWVPCSVDKDHFVKARSLLVEPDDQIFFPHPRIGYYGAIDERFNYELVMQMADLRSDFQFIIIGPIRKIDPRVLPRRSNIHYLGQKDYASLPLYLSGWDCAMMPFALNEATRFISPSKTYEFLAGGKPVISTSVNDVKDIFAKKGLVRLADDPEDFLDALDESMDEGFRACSSRNVEAFLDETSWDKTFERLAQLELAISGHERDPHRSIRSPLTFNANEAV